MREPFGADGRWEWQMADGRWQMADGRWHTDRTARCELCGGGGVRGIASERRSRGTAAPPGGPRQRRGGAEGAGQGRPRGQRGIETRARQTSIVPELLE